MAELKKEMKRQGTSFLIKSWFCIEKLAKQADDEGLDDDALMGELDDLDQDGFEAAKIYIQQLKGLVDESKKKALKEK